MISRRRFCRSALVIAGGCALPMAALELFDPKRLRAEKSGPGKTRWVFLVDTYKCIGCGFCVKACKRENEIPSEADVSRTWVERYVVTKDGEVFADSPKEARNGFTSKRVDLGLGRFKDIPQERI